MASDSERARATESIVMKLVQEVLELRKFGWETASMQGATTELLGWARARSRKRIYQARQAEGRAGSDGADECGLQ
jgi:hypothetical protein